MVCIYIYVYYKALDLSTKWKLQKENIYIYSTDLEQLLSAAKVSTTDEKTVCLQFLSIWLWQPRLNGGMAGGLGGAAGKNMERIYATQQ